ncbi:MAG: hypothetical protein ABIP61_16980 [Burkholderiaceae bacterium]
MLRNLRILLMCLVALAVPVQGFAAMSMSGCGPGHHGAWTTQADAGPMHEDVFGTPPHAHDAGLEVDSSGHHPDASAAAVHGDVSEAQLEGKLGAGSCSACATCCLAAALPATTLSFEAISEADFIAPLIPHSATSFFTESPERPPRPVLA